MSHSTRIAINDDVQTIAEFMQSNLPATRLVGVARALNQLAPILWGQHGSEDIQCLALLSNPPCEPHKPAVSTE